MSQSLANIVVHLVFSTKVVAPIQGGGKLFDDIHTRGFTPGYHMTGFQPLGWALDAESAEVLGNIKQALSSSNGALL